MPGCKYGKVRDHHCWWLTINGKSVANFDNESDVDGIVATQTQLNQKAESISNAVEFLEMIPLHTDDPHVLHFTESAHEWLSKKSKSDASK